MWEPGPPPGGPPSPGTEGLRPGPGPAESGPESRTRPKSGTGAGPRFPAPANRESGPGPDSRPNRGPNRGRESGSLQPGFRPAAGVKFFGHSMRRLGQRLSGGAMHSQEPRGSSWSASCARAVIQRPGRYGLARRPAQARPGSGPVHWQWLCVHRIKGSLKSSIGGFGLLLSATLFSHSLGVKLTLQLLEQFPIRLCCATKQFA